MASKGKGIAKDTSSGKRKLRDDTDSSAARKRMDRSVLQFFEDVSPELGAYSDDSDFLDDFMEEEFEPVPAFKNDDSKAQNIPFFPKEEEMNEEEFDRMMEEHYSRGPGLGAFAEENYENKISTGRNPPQQSARDIISLWKVKCMVGRERQSVFCLMQKFVDLHSFGTKLQIKSAFCVEHIKGFIYIEAPRQYDLIEACKGINGIYSTRIASVPENDISQLLTVQSRVSEVAVGTMARVKNGKYKGDLAQIVAVNNARKRATVKLIPRIDLQSMAEKFGGGVVAKKVTNPAPRLINSSELEEFRPLMQFRRDRETGKLFEFLDGMMLKDGYLYKKVSLDSLNCWGVMPSEDELLKFKPPESIEANDLEWLSQLYGEKKKKKIIRTEKGGGKGEGSSGSSSMISFGDHDLVCFGRKDFGMILGTEKDDSYKILKDGLDGSVVVNVQRKELKSGPLDAKFTSVDHNGKIISVSDNVKVLEGSLKDKQGIVKHVYRHTVFVYDENEVDNDGYFSCKSNLCAKIKISYDAPSGKEDDKGFSGFEDFSSSPKSPLSPKKPWAEKEGREYNRDDRGDGMFSIGQTLRIRVGPLKGYLCRVIAVRKRDVTVKLDSRQKVLTVRFDLLTEVHRKSSAVSVSEDPEFSSLKPFDILGNEGSSQDWMGGTGSSAAGDGWNSAGASSERSPWPSFPESGTLNCPGSSSTNPFGSENLDAKKDVEDSPWVSKSTAEANTSWGTANSSVDTANDDQACGWGKSESWDKATAKTISDGNVSGAWGKSIVPSGDSAGDKWDKGKHVTSDNQTGKWGGGTSGKNELSEWSRDKDSESGGWKKNPSVSVGDNNTPSETSADKWGSKNRSNGSWGHQNVSTTVSEIQTAGKDNVGGWTKPGAENKINPSGWNEDTSMKGGQTSNWGNQDEAGGWGKPMNVGDGGSSAWNKTTACGDGNDSWKKSNESEREGGNRSWNSKSSDGDSAIWKDKSHSSRLTASKGDQWGGGWNKQHSSNETKASEDNSPWNKKSVESGKDNELENQGSGWNVGKTSGDSASGWGQTSKEAGSSDQGSSWGSNWKKKSDTGNEDSSSAKKSNWSSGSGNLNWGEKSNWNSGNEFNAYHSNNGAEAQTEVSNDWRGESSDRGGFRGIGSFRGRGERGRFGGRGRSDRGGFGRGGSDRGGFGGRGRGRWNSEGGSNDGDNKGWSSGGGDWEKSSSDRGGFGVRGRGRWNRESGSNDGENRGWSSGGGDRERSGSDRGGFRGRGRGRWNQEGGSRDGDNGGGWSGGRGGYGGRGRGRWNQESGSNDGGDSGGRGGGSWEKSQSDRGGFGGRGRGRWNREGDTNDCDNGGGWSSGGNWGKSGSDRGGFGGGGSGKWSQEGGSNNSDYGGWSGGGGGSWGKSGSDRGGFGGRGRGRRNQDGGSNDDDNVDKPASWSTGSGNNGEWGSGDGTAGSWIGGGDDKNQQQSWKSSNDAGEGSGWKAPSGNENINWKASGSSGVNDNSGWNKSTACKEIEESGDQKNSWGKAAKADTHTQGGGWQKSASGWNEGTDNQSSMKDVNAVASDGGWNDQSENQAKYWKSSEASGEGQSSVWKPSTWTTDKEADSSQKGNWNKEANAGAQGGGGGWDKPTSSNDAAGWGKSSYADDGKSLSGWGR
ncbi:protein RNA-directed DNA methylation 3-like [Cucurbita maxima]|uniref:Protein RNA-directed DNA methylation 3-like n=1 Tax=Cucurbita maxima TaxID=3661 RepID=A0A6J1JSK2_CUCMA|nr:protein RNA-directed DNA methylation 3-like [Cucurbita maxima]